MKKLHDALVDLRNEALKHRAGDRNTWIEPAAGICAHVADVTGDRGVTMVMDWFHLWPKYSGSSCHPVPGPGGMNATCAYWNIDDVWVGEYGDLRMELLDFLIEKAAKELA